MGAELEARLPRWPHMRAAARSGGPICSTTWLHCTGTLSSSTWKAYWCIPAFGEANALHTRNGSKIRRAALRWRWLAVLHLQKLERRIGVPCKPFWLSLATPFCTATMTLSCLPNAAAAVDRFFSLRVFIMANMKTRDSSHYVAEVCDKQYPYPEIL